MSPRNSPPSRPLMTTTKRRSFAAGRALKVRRLTSTWRSGCPAVAPAAFRGPRHGVAYTEKRLRAVEGSPVSRGVGGRTSWREQSHAYRASQTCRPLLIRSPHGVGRSKVRRTPVARWHCGRSTILTSTRCRPDARPRSSAQRSHTQTRGAPKSRKPFCASVSHRVVPLPGPRVGRCRPRRTVPKMGLPWD